VAGFCKHGNEPSSSNKVGKFLEYLSESLVLNEDSVQWS